MALLTNFLIKWRYQIVSPYVAGKVLDIGCGGGGIYELFSKNIQSYFGIDCNPQKISQLNKQAGKERFFCRDLDTEPIAITEKFDVILMIAVIEHIWNQKFVLGQLADMLKPKGRLIITTPTPFGNDVVHAIGGYFGLFAKSAVSDHVVIYNRRRFKILENQFHLKLKKYKQFQFFCNQLAVFEKSEVFIQP